MASNLNVKNNPSPTDIKKAYKKAALKWHPDRCKDKSKKKNFEKSKKTSE